MCTDKNGSAYFDAQHREILAAEDSYKRLLESLYFPDIHARQEGIEEAHRQTYEWIFRNPGDKHRPWHSFIDWLEHGHGTYWVSGKAGSGKSTLMNFLCHDPRTKTALENWSGINEIFMPAFFFWSPGTQLQKSLAGLLRSIVYQIMEKFPNLMPVLAKSIGPTKDGLHQLPTWTEQRLRATLEDLLPEVSKTYHLCIFIDGLDEFDGDQAILLNLIRNLERFTSIKFCLSSRPYRLFRDELGSSAMLKLQDLTEPDIRKFVSERFNEASLKALQVPYLSLNVHDIVNRIVWRSQGVFLWVKLAVRDQIEGIREEDDSEQLLRRLEALPNEIEGLYGHMLQKINKVHHKEAAQYLQLVLSAKRLSLFEVALAAHKRVDDVLLFSPEISMHDIRLHCEYIRDRVSTTCRGFLEVCEYKDRHKWERDKADLSKVLAMRKMSHEQLEDLTEMLFFSEWTRVDFLHRTAYDFFQDNEQGKLFLAANTSTNPHPRVLYVKASIANAVMFPLDDSRIQLCIDNAMYHTRVAEEEIGFAQPALMDLFDRSITLLYKQYAAQPSESHWCRSCASLGTYGFLNGPRNDGGLIFGAVDFPGYAAYHGLARYVEHILDSQSGQSKPGTANYLLRCAVFSLYVFGSVARLKTMSTLLRRGANPNTEESGSTAWRVFLSNLHRTTIQHSDDFRSTRSVWRSSALAFLASGANINERASCFFASSFYDDTRQLVKFKPTTLPGYSITMCLSARSILQQCFAKDPNFPDFEDTFTAFGASAYSECTKIYFKAKDLDGSIWVDPRLSKQQLQQLTNTLERHHETIVHDRKERRRLYEPLVLGLLQELDMKRLVEEARREKQLQDKTRKDENSQEDWLDTDTDSSFDFPSPSTVDSQNPQEEDPLHSAHISQEED